ncbi:MAG: hypothetical protein FRX48_09638 [Lasallia pustulata]|uniref:Uncharacterized protein n=1 Tax=Lasallia pustulata TaxID=136370 RepID=A0A5M8PBZ1_9LECA|nr:MAG: hypothetical protein FRX48_09638 [Lasallia pustulata]
MSMDGDSSAKTMEAGANSAMKDQELTSGIHESTNQIPAAGEKTTGTGASMFDKDGAIGSMFKPDGAIGGTAQSIGGPLDKTGAIGQHFNADGKIGGMIQEKLASKK